jgi:hypothetical protein
MNGSVFEVAARANGVTYDRPCCGTQSMAFMLLSRPVTLYTAFTVVMVAVFML